MRLLADINVSPRTVEFLNEIGHDSVWAGALIPGDSPDEAIIALALETGRVIVTSDLDFPRLIMLSGASEPSLLLLRLESGPEGDSHTEQVNRALAAALPTAAEYQDDGFICTIDETGYRIRSLRTG